MEPKNAELVQDGMALISEGEHFLKIKRSKLYELMDQGRLQYVKIDRSRRIPWAVLRAFAAQNLTAASQEAAR
ncbi:MAG: helix-turn-helix domain-containing protein [Planctomycetales bacterium]|nr:helix-turn-helix domain-containing protein [Planctomycetales bacterium]